MDITDYEGTLVKAFDSEKVTSSARNIALELLEELRSHHEPTFQHSVRVGLVAREIARFGSFDSKMGLYGVLHDIGKLRMPREILDRTTNFTDGDMAIMRGHVTEGFRILMEKGLRFTAWVALAHHRYQRNPYPLDQEMPAFPIVDANADTRLLADECARIVSISDTYDATRTRQGSRFGGRVATGEEVKRTMLENNPQRRILIERLYESGILSV